VGFRAGKKAVEKRNIPAEVRWINNRIRSNLKSDSSFQNMSPVTDKSSWKEHCTRVDGSGLAPGIMAGQWCWMEPKFL